MERELCPSPPESVEEEGGERDGAVVGNRGLDGGEGAGVLGPQRPKALEGRRRDRRNPLEEDPVVEHEPRKQRRREGDEPEEEDHRKPPGGWIRGVVRGRKGGVHRHFRDWTDFRGDFYQPAARPPRDDAEARPIPWAGGTCVPSVAGEDSIVMGRGALGSSLLLLGVPLLGGCASGRAWVEDIDPPRPTAKHERHWEEDEALLAEERAQQTFVPRPVIRIGVLTDLPPESTSGSGSAATPAPPPGSVTNVYVTQNNPSPVLGYGYFPYRTSFGGYRPTFGTSFTPRSSGEGSSNRDRPAPRVGADWPSVPSYGTPAVITTAPGY